MCKPVYLGGLGIKDLELHNLAFIARSGWRIFNSPDSIVTQLLQAKYCQNTKLWDCVKKNGSSRCWNTLLRDKDIILAGLKWSVGDGSSINVWSDSWVLNFPLSNLIPNIPSDVIGMRVEGIMDRNVGEWKLD